MTLQQLTEQIALNPESALWMEVALRYYGVTETRGAIITPEINTFFNSTVSSSTSITADTARAEVRRRIENGRATNSISVERATALLARNSSMTGVADSLSIRHYRPQDDSGGNNAWCAAFANHVMISSVGSGSHDVGAYKWMRWGYRIPRTVNPIPFGAILVFSRTGGNHVGFYVGEERSHYLVYGGNQSRDILSGIHGNVGIVGVSRYPKSALQAIRWPFNYEVETVRPTPVHRHHHRHR